MGLVKKYWYYGKKIELEKKVLEKLNKGDVLFSKGKIKEAIVDYFEVIELNFILLDVYLKLVEILVN